MDERGRLKVFIVYQYFQDASAPGHTRALELSHYLLRSAHGVRVVTGRGDYMSTSGPEASAYGPALWRGEEVESIPVTRVRTYQNLHGSYHGRLWAFISFMVLAIPAGLGGGRPDVVLVSSPPLFAGLPGLVLSKLWRVPFVFEVRDLWPESATEMGLVKPGGLTARALDRLAQTLYRHAALVVPLTRGIQQRLEALGFGDKSLLITNGVDLSQLTPNVASGQAVRRKLGYEDHDKLLVYAGALGQANNIEVLLRLMKRLQHGHPGIKLLLVGDGKERARLERLAQQWQLGNVRFLGPVGKVEIPRLLNAADLCVAVLMDVPVFQGAIPNKMLDYMACGKAVLIGIRGEAEAIVRDAGAGASFAPDDDAKAAERVVAMLSDQAALERMGRNARAYVETHFDRAKLSATLADRLQSLTDSR